MKYSADPKSTFGPYRGVLLGNPGVSRHRRGMFLFRGVETLFQEEILLEVFLLDQSSKDNSLNHKLTL